MRGGRERLARPTDGERERERASIESERASSIKASPRSLNSLPDTLSPCFFRSQRRIGSQRQSAQKNSHRGLALGEREASSFPASGGWTSASLCRLFRFVLPFDRRCFTFLSTSPLLSSSSSIAFYSPVFDVDTSATLHGLPLTTRCAFLRIVPACCGNVSDAPESDDSKWTSCCSSSEDCFRFCDAGDRERMLKGGRLVRRRKSDGMGGGRDFSIFFEEATSKSETRLLLCGFFPRSIETAVGTLTIGETIFPLSSSPALCCGGQGDMHAGSPWLSRTILKARAREPSVWGRRGGGSESEKKK